MVTAKQTPVTEPKDPTESTSTVIALESKASEDFIDLFSIDGTTFSVQARPRPNIALKYMKELRDTKNAEVAQAGLLIDMIGEDGYEALVNCDGLTPDQFENIVQIVSDLAMGGMEKAQGKSTRGSRR
jgi:hypothetical protein